MLRCDVRVLQPRLRHGRRWSCFGWGGRGSYGARTEERREGNGAEAHSGLGGLDGKLGDALETAGRRRRYPVAGEEDDVDGGALGPPEARGLTERWLATWRSLQTWRESEGEAVATTAMSCGDGSARPFA